MTAKKIRREKSGKWKECRVTNSLIIQIVILLIVIVLSIYLILVKPGEDLIQEVIPEVMLSEEMSENVDETIVSYLELYIGVLNINIKNKTIEKLGGHYIWIANVSTISRNRLVNFEIHVGLDEEKNPKVEKILEWIEMPEEPRTLISIPGKISCSYGEKILIQIFIDPYDPWSREYNELIEQFEDKFKGDIDVAYRLVRTYSMDSWTEDIANTFKYLKCVAKIRSDDLEKFRATKNCIYQKYEEKNQTLNETAVIECALLSEIDKEELKNCTEEEALKLIAIDETFAATYLGAPSTPTIVIDCRYKTWPTFINRGMCYLYPELDSCQ